MKNKLILPNIRLGIFTLFLLAMVWLVPATGSCFTATAQVDKTRIVPGERVSLSIVVDGGKAKVDLSPIRDFQILSSGTSTSRSYVNGQWHHQVVYRYQLVPEKTGVLKIPPLKVIQAKEQLLTEEIQILVSKAASSADQPRQLYVEAHVASSNLVVGQQTVYTIKLFAAARFARATLKAPGFETLAAQELTERKKYTRTINGTPYLVNEIYYILQAEKPGQVEIGPAVIMADLIQKTTGRDPVDSFFNDSFFTAGRTKSVQVASNGVVLEVKPLPSYTGKIPFSGLVGQFTMGAVIDKKTLPAGESATLTLTIQGKGNIMDAGPPLLDLNQELVKVYDDTPTEEMTATVTGFSGKKIFKRALVPMKAGPLVIPGFSLAYFDVEAQEYKTLKTDEILLDVMGGAVLTTDSSPFLDQGAMGATSDDMAGQKKEVVMVNNDILDIKDSISILSTPFQLNFLLFVLLVFAPGLIYGCMAFLFRFKTREKSNEALMNLRANQALKTAEKRMASGKPFLNHVQTGLVAAILARADKQGESLTCGEARQILQQTGTKASVIDEVVTLLDTLDASRFGGKSLDTPKEDTSPGRVKKLIKMLGILFCCLGLFSHDSPVVFAQDRTGHEAFAALSDSLDLTVPFVAGIKQYRAGEFLDAAKNFKTIAGSGVVNPDLFYNIGNAYLKAHDLGNAILWYERAKRLAPSDPDLLFNLAHANSLVKDKIDSPVTLGDILFFWQGWLPLRWLQAATIVLSCLFFLWAGVQTFRQKPILSGTGWVFLSLLIVLFLAVSMENYRGRAENMAVIVQDAVAVRSGTTQMATKLFELHAGTRVQVKAKKNGYLKIRLKKGRVGWVKPGDATVI